MVMNMFGLRNQVNYLTLTCKWICSFTGNGKKILLTLILTITLGAVMLVLVGSLVYYMRKYQRDNQGIGHYARQVLLPFFCNFMDYHLMSWQFKQMQLTTRIIHSSVGGLWFLPRKISQAQTCLGKAVLDRFTRWCNSPIQKYLEQQS